MKDLAPPLFFAPFGVRELVKDGTQRDV